MSAILINMVWIVENPMRLRSLEADSGFRLHPARPLNNARGAKFVTPAFSLFCSPLKHYAHSAELSLTRHFPLAGRTRKWWDDLFGLMRKPV